MVLHIPVRSEDKGSPLLAYGSQGVPQGSAGYRVHASCWFIQKHNRGVAQDRYGCAQLPLVTTTDDTWNQSKRKIQWEMYLKCLFIFSAGFYIVIFSHLLDNFWSSTLWIRYIYNNNNIYVYVQMCIVMETVIEVSKTYRNNDSSS